MRAGRGERRDGVAMLRLPTPTGEGVETVRREGVRSLGVAKESLDAFPSLPSSSSGDDLEACMSDWAPPSRAAILIDPPGEPPREPPGQ